VIASKTEGVTPLLYLRLGIIPGVIFLGKSNSEREKNHPCLKNLHPEPEGVPDSVQPLEKRAFYLDKRDGIGRRALHH
jgi:hypothetical protein